MEAFQQCEEHTRREYPVLQGLVKSLTSPFSFVGVSSIYGVCTNQDKAQIMTDRALAHLSRCFHVVPASFGTYSRYPHCTKLP